MTQTTPPMAPTDLSKIRQQFAAAKQGKQTVQQINLDVTIEPEKILFFQKRGDVVLKTPQLTMAVDRLSFALVSETGMTLGKVLEISYIRTRGIECDIALLFMAQETELTYHQFILGGGSKGIRLNLPQVIGVPVKNVVQMNLSFRFPVKPSEAEETKVLKEQGLVGSEQVSPQKRRRLLNKIRIDRTIRLANEAHDQEAKAKLETILRDFVAAGGAANVEEARSAIESVMTNPRLSAMGFDEAQEALRDSLEESGFNAAQ